MNNSTDAHSTTKALLILSAILIFASLFLPVIEIPQVVNFTLFGLMSLYADKFLFISVLFILISTGVILYGYYRIEHDNLKIIISVGIGLLTIPIFQILDVRNSIDTEAGSSIVDFSLGFFTICAGAISGIFAIINIPQEISSNPDTIENEPAYTSNTSQTTRSQKEISPESKYCGDCGSNNPRSNKFCSECGYQF